MLALMSPALKFAVPPLYLNREGGAVDGAVV
jgi:hypothetical protein